MLCITSHAAYHLCPEETFVNKNDYTIYRQARTPPSAYMHEWECSEWWGLEKKSLPQEDVDKGTRMRQVGDNKSWKISLDATGIRAAATPTSVIHHMEFNMCPVSPYQKNGFWINAELVKSRFIKYPIIFAKNRPVEDDLVIKKKRLGSLRIGTMIVGSGVSTAQGGVAVLGQGSALDQDQQLITLVDNGLPFAIPCANQRTNVGSVRPPVRRTRWDRVLSAILKDRLNALNNS